jgi:hypothetical protein
METVDSLGDEDCKNTNANSQLRSSTADGYRAITDDRYSSMKQQNNHQSQLDMTSGTMDIGKRKKIRTNHGNRKRHGSQMANFNSSVPNVHNSTEDFHKVKQVQYQGQLTEHSERSKLGMLNEREAQARYNSITGMTDFN